MIWQDRSCGQCRRELDVVFHVVSGIFNPHYDALCRMALADDRIRVHRNVSRMSELMRECDIAITARWFYHV